ncbi:MAG: DUF3047 domain-containing protein [Candidatus Omnitrophota bacterium]|jgi:hypothetical protein
MIKRVSLVVVAVLSSAVFLSFATGVVLKQFTFNENDALDQWSKMVLNGAVDYELIKQGRAGYVQAISDKACSAIYYKMPYKVKDYPLLGWKWKVVAFPDISKARTPKEKDDYAARVYVIFPHLSFTFSKFIEYVWAEDIPAGTIFDSPYGKNVKMIVVRSGRTNSGEWVSESRNVYEDYVKAFGTEPKKDAAAIAIMCDADSTKTMAESLFDDIAVSAPETRSIEEVKQI